MNFRQTLLDIANEQTDGETCHDAKIHVHIGGGNAAIYRGRIVVEDDVVSVFRTVYALKGGVARPTRWPSHHVPTNAAVEGHAEVPMHIRLDNVVMVEWAVNDYSEGV